MTDLSGGKMNIRPEVLPFWSVTLLVGALLALLARRFGRRSWFAALVPAGVLSAVFLGYFAHFFRDPDRIPPADPSVIVASADGHVAGIETLDEARFRAAASFSGLNTEQVDRFLAGGSVVRLSIFLSLFDVHVNRAPMSGNYEFLGYFPGKHYFTFHEKSSDHNQHNAILMRNEKTVCMINQIVGPICRRVVYWPDHDRPTALQIGDRIGMMKFGSRLDMYFPAGEVVLTAAEGDRTRAGETVIGRLVEEGVR
jgi:phosphatidylserine decarboxylase